MVRSQTIVFSISFNLAVNTGTISGMNTLIHPQAGIGWADSWRLEVNGVQVDACEQNPADAWRIKAMFKTQEWLDTVGRMAGLFLNKHAGNLTTPSELDGATTTLLSHNSITIARAATTGVLSYGAPTGAGNIILPLRQQHDIVDGRPNTVVATLNLIFARPSPADMQRIISTKDKRAVIVYSRYRSRRQTPGSVNYSVQDNVVAPVNYYQGIYVSGTDFPIGRGNELSGIFVR
jgi:hypothetical protein